MLIPLGTDRPSKRRTVVTYVYAAVCVAVFAAQRFAGGMQGLDPVTDALILRPGESPWWSFVTYAILHGGFMHLLGNMVFLLSFGPAVEDRFGRIGFSLFLVGGAVVAGLAHMLSSGAPVVGASGAISGITGAFLILFPRTRVRVLWFFILITIITPPAWFLIGLAIAKDLFLEFGGSGGNVAHAAHLGGYAYGAGLALGLLASGVLKREPYDLLSMMKQRARRRQFRAAAGGAAPARVAAERGRLSPTESRVEQHAPDRAEVIVALNDGREDDAVRAYRALLSVAGDVPEAVTLSPKAQLAIGNVMMQRGDHAAAATAYDRFLDAYRADPEAPSVRLLLGLVLARYLNDPIRAKRELVEAKLRVRSERERALAEELLAELG